MPTASSNDPLHFHKAALRPLLRTLDKQETIVQLNSLDSGRLPEFFGFLKRHGLWQLWLEFLSKQASIPPAFEHFVFGLRQAALGIAARQLLQRKVLDDVKDAFDQAGIQYLVFKGAHLRYTLYQDPTHRPISDIDILVRDECKLDAVKALLRSGFYARHKAKNISHETSLRKNGVWIDLHWHLMRPGRTRVDLNDYLFDQRQLFGCLAGLSFEASLLVMLIHPAITKYVNGAPSLIRLVDLHRLLQIEQINREKLLTVLSESGMRTAAWASLTFATMRASNLCLGTRGK